MILFVDSVRSADVLNNISDGIITSVLSSGPGVQSVAASPKEASLDIL